MQLPHDPYVLLSYINTALRDEYDSFDELCSAWGVDGGEITRILSAAGFRYNAQANRFA